MTVPQYPTLFFDNNPLLPAEGDFSQFFSIGFGECVSSWDCDGTYKTINDNPLTNNTLKMEDLNVIFQARDSIVLLPDFEVKLNAMFEVVMDDCSK